MRCECGGVQRKTVLSRFDFSAYAGIPATLVDAPGFRCSKCGHETLGGVLINRALQLLVQAIVAGPERLSAPGARFLRKSMRLTQQELADRLGANRIRVTNWERGAVHDAIAVYAAALAGTTDDLDPMLEAVAIEHLAGQDPSAT